MRKIFWLTLIFGIVVGLFLRDLFPKTPVAAKVVTIQSRNLKYEVVTKAKTIGDVLTEQGLSQFVIASDPERSEGERGNPHEIASSSTFGRLLAMANQSVVHGMTIEIKTPLKVFLVDGGKEPITTTTTAETVSDLLFELQIALSATDQVKPDVPTFLVNYEQITIDRIVDLEVSEVSEIPFEMKLENEASLRYGRENTLASGKVGQIEKHFLITYKNGVEIKRKLLSQKILEKPVLETRQFGTKIEIEEQKEGRASWYAYKACMCAAHPFYDRGRYARVTSVESGESIIVRINDRGPDMSLYPDRIIDLDAVAFRALAQLGSGTIEVRVELFKN